MATQPTAPPAIAALPPAPSSSTGTPSEFDEKANNTVAAQVAMIPQINTANVWAKQTAQEVYSNALEAEQSVLDAEQSVADAEQSVVDVSVIAANLASSVNFKGKWSDLDGQLIMPASVIHNGAYWQLLYSLANVALSEPSTDSDYWAFISGGDFIYTESSTTIPAGAQMQVSAITNPVDIDLPQGITVGKTITLRNNINSTELVRLTNSHYSITGNGGTLSAGDNLIFTAGVTKTLVCRAVNILEIL